MVEWQTACERGVDFVDGVDVGARCFRLLYSLSSCGIVAGVEVV